MKKTIIHSVPVVISLIWLILIKHTFNPVFLKGPDFLRFYLILLSGFYISVFALKIFEEKISSVTFYCMLSILILGIIKLIRGIFLGKPVGFLILILIMEFAVFLFVRTSYISHKMK